MKKIIFLVIVILLTGCIRENYSDDITHFKYYYGSGLGGNNIYELNKNDDRYYITYTIDTYFSDEDKKEIKNEVNEEFVKNLNDIIKELNIYSWNNFNKTNQSVLDGESFTLHIGYSDAKEINAQGYMKFPKNYHDFKNKIMVIFKNTK